MFCNSILFVFPIFYCCKRNWNRFRCDIHIYTCVPYFSVCLNCLMYLHHTNHLFSSFYFSVFSYQKIRSSQTGEVPINYRCYKCHKQGHWIKNCPMNINMDTSDVKRNTGIPRSFIDGQNESIQPMAVPPPIEKKQEIPEDLICSICKDLFTDAVMIPCCGSSFCDECEFKAIIYIFL